MKCQAALVLVLAYFTAAYECPARTPVTKVFEADLETGTTFVQSGYGISWVSTLTSPVSGASCSRQGVIKITYPTPSPEERQKRCFKFDLHLSSPSGWNFNIGDSTNNGYGGDAGQTSNAAEVHNIGDSFYVYSNVLEGFRNYGSPGILVEKKSGVVKRHVSVTIGDEFVKYESCSWNKCYASRYLFTLNGQAADYGQVNYDIFFSMNRVIQYHSDRTGTGLCKAIITAMDCDFTSGENTGGGDSGCLSRLPGDGTPESEGPVNTDDEDPRFADVN